MIRVKLTPDQEQSVQGLRRDTTLHPAERDRVEMVLLSVEGWSPPRIAQHRNCQPATVRQVLKRFVISDLTSLRRRRPGPPRDTTRRQQVTTALDRLLGQARTWTAAQLAEALHAEGIALSARQTRKYLTLMGARWRRTISTLQHKQDAARVEQATRVLASRKKSPPSGRSAWSSLMSAVSVPASPVP
jgi:transposase